MGRSVNYHSDTYKKIYLRYELDEADYDECIAEENWEFFEEYIMEAIQEVASSFTKCKEEWHDQEVKKIAQNNLCSVWISEYCGFISLSFVPNEDDYTDRKTGLAKHWIDQVFPKIQKKLINAIEVLNKIGSFSNGESIFELAK